MLWYLRAFMLAPSFFFFSLSFAHRTQKFSSDAVRSWFQKKFDLLLTKARFSGCLIKSQSHMVSTEFIITLPEYKRVAAEYGVVLPEVGGAASTPESLDYKACFLVLLVD